MVRAASATVTPPMLRFDHWRASLASNYLTWPGPITGNAVHGSNELPTHALVAHCHGDLVQPFFASYQERGRSRRILLVLGSGSLGFFIGNYPEVEVAEDVADL